MLITWLLFSHWVACNLATTLWTKKHTKMFLSYLPQNPVDSGKIWYTLSWINLRYSSLNVFQLTWIMSLHYFVKLTIRVFVKILMLEKRNSTNFTYWLWFQLLKKVQPSDFELGYGKFNQENMYQSLSESASFCKRYDKTFWCVFLVHSSNCCSLAQRKCQVS